MEPPHNTLSSIFAMQVTVEIKVPEDPELNYVQGA
jgi:hypothetical protein